MNEIRTKLQMIFKQISLIFSAYPLTLVLVAALSLSCAVFIDRSGTWGRFMEDNGIPFLLLWGTGTFFAETLWEGRKIPRRIGDLSAGCFSALLIGLRHSASDIRGAEAEHWMWAYALTMILMGVYFNFRKKDICFEAYCFRIIQDLAGLGIICFITGLGTALVVSVFVTLILNGTHGMLVIRAEFLVLGCLLGGGILNALVTEKQKPSRFFILIVRYLLPVLLLTAFAVVYVYMLKILVTRVVPSNEIFRIIAGLFIIGLPVWTMAGTFEEDRFPTGIVVKLPFIFIPFIFLQGYAIRERIMAYGMTPSRYLCLGLIVFEIFYIAIYAFRKRDIAVILPAAAVLMIVSFIVPAVNMFDVSLRSQKRIFDAFVSSDFDTLSFDDRSSLAGAFYYLEGDPAGKRLLEDVPEQKAEQIRNSGMIGIRKVDQNFYIMEVFPLQQEDVSGYRLMTSVGYEEEDPSETDLSAVPLRDKTGEILLTADLKPYIDEFSAMKKDNKDLPTRFTVDDQRVIRVQSLNLVQDQDGRIQWFSFSGLLFEK